MATVHQKFHMECSAVQPVFGGDCLNIGYSNMKKTDSRLLTTLQYQRIKRRGAPFLIQEIPSWNIRSQTV